ncbi:MAG: hypothetical protein HPAVJP_3080 [Candidatus Hepatoplasma vulgare]|nr:MAG: hypothetical protein HPAVJP_3080 [Candidatus Hepatoplasma sp.]
MFFSLWTLYENLNEIIKYSTANDERIITRQWRLKIYITGIFFTFIINYSYIYLKKNNFKQISANKNTMINIIIIVFFIILCWGTTFTIMFFQIKPLKDLYNSYDYNVVIYIFFIMFFYNLIFLFVFSLINEFFKKIHKKANFLYIFLILVIVLQIIFIFNIQNFISLSNDKILDKLHNTSFILFFIMIIFFILNLLEKIIFRKLYKKNI